MVGAEMEDLIDQAEGFAGVGVNGERVVALVAAAAAVADGTESEGGVSGEIEFGGILGEDDDGRPVETAEVFESGMGVSGEDGGVGEFGSVGESEEGAVCGGVTELVGERAFGVGEDVVSGINEAASAASVAQVERAEVALAERPAVV